METIGKNKKVSIAYSLKDVNGTILEEVPENLPFTYMHGYGKLIKGLEEALEGLHVGDSKRVFVPFSKGYGIHKKELIIKVPKEELKSIGEIWIGMDLEMYKDSSSMEFSVPEDPKDLYACEDEEDPEIFTILEIQENYVILDGNHPFAGKDMTFDVTVVKIEEATASELETGYPDEDSADEDFDEEEPEDGRSNLGRRWR